MSDSIRISDLLFNIKFLKDQVKDFQSGEKYLHMKEEYDKMLREEERRIRHLESELACAHAQIIDVRNKWSQTCEDVFKEKEKELARKDRELKRMEEKMFLAQRQRDEAEERLRQKNLELYDVMTQLDEAQGKILALQARINKDYTNSSKPSSMSPNHKTIHNGREKSGHKAGGQKGHIHHERRKHKPDRKVEIPAPDKYLEDDNYKPTGRYVRKQVISLRIIAYVTEYYTMEFRDQTTGQRVHATFPDGIKDDVTYDGSVKAFAYLLNNSCNISIGKTKQFLKEVSNGKIDLSTGMICDLSRQFSRKTQTQREEIFNALLASPVMHADFTFGRVNGKQGTVLVCATPGRVLYLGRKKKGHDGIKGSPLEIYNGIIVSDHEATFHSYGGAHQECLVHVQRHAKSSKENEPGLEWNKQVLEWTSEAIHYWNELQRGEAYDAGTVKDLIDRYGQIMKKAQEEYEYEPPSEYFTDGYNLYKRMQEDAEDYYRFLLDPSIPPSNNLAERCARKTKRKFAQVMAFRSQEGLDYFCDGLSIVETMRSEGANVYNEVAKLFNQGMAAW